MTTAHEIVSFWRDAGPERWFGGGDSFDAQCRERCLEAHFRAARREFEDWAAQPEGALALVLLLDQIPRNVFRRSGHAYATDPLARHYAHRALELFGRLPAGADRWAKHHHEIIRRFGRFPHRNAPLGRESTREEREFLAQGGFSG